MPRPSPRLLSVCALTALALACAHVAVGHARSDVLDVSGPLRAVSLSARAAVLEDPGAGLRLEDVLARDAEFVPTRNESNVGFSSSAYWFRLRVENQRDHERAWLLELGYPLLDDVTIFVPREDGRYQARRTGDMYPFPQRDIAYRNFVFSLEEPPRSERTYYLRVVSTGSVRVPLTAWSLREFMEYQHFDWTVLCMFYGGLLVMACYSLCLWAVTKQREYVSYALYVFSMGGYQFTVSGHAFQFLFPHDMWLVHRLLPITVLSTLLCAIQVVKNSVFSEQVRRLTRWASGLCVLLAVLGATGPYGLSVRAATLATFLLLALAIVFGVHMARADSRQAKLFLLGWSGAIAGGVAATLVAFGWLPSNAFTKWMLQVGVSVQLVLLSSSYADKFNVAREQLAGLHDRLSHKLTDLSAALTRAEEASERARHATRLKNEFMATMSHEFRTPLNPIINIPQGVRAEFTEVARAQCEGCNATFELDEGDRIDEHTACPECQRTGSLRPRKGYKFTGNGLRARALLSKVERSGRHLLTAVNGVLDFSKMQAGHLRLVREELSVGRLLAEVEESHRAQAVEQGVTVAVELPDGELTLTADVGRIGQVLGCLLDNAIKYSSPGQTVTLRAVRSGASCRFSVRDLGIGIAQENFERIFESFEQVHKGHTRKYGGTGLGLAIARSLVRMHGAELRVESTLGQGSTFCFELPLDAVTSQARSA